MAYLKKEELEQLAASREAITIEIGDRKSVTGKIIKAGDWKNERFSFIYRAPGGKAICEIMYLLPVDIKFAAESYAHEKKKYGQRVRSTGLDENNRKTFMLDGREKATLHHFSDFECLDKLLQE
jgi:hypothetical protein